MSEPEQNNKTAVSQATAPQTMRDWLNERLARITDLSTIYLLGILVVSMFVAEAIIMTGLREFEIQSGILEGVLDATFLTLAIFPVLYVLIFKKIVRQNEQLETVKDKLRLERKNLESLVEKRTAEINCVNQNLAESLTRFTDIEEISCDWIWEMDANLRMSFLSDRFFEVFPVNRDQVIGKTRLEFSGLTEIDEHWRAHYDDIANHRPFRNFQYKTTQSDGRPHNIQISGKPIFDANGVFTGYRGTGTDRTSELEALDAVAESEAQFRNLIEGSIQGVFVHKDWNLLFANQALADILGYESVEDVMALETSYPIIAPEEHERLWGFKEARAKGESPPEIYEARCLKKDGSQVWLEFRVRVVDWCGEAAMQCVAVDITERKKAEEALLLQKAELEQILADVPRAIITIDEKGAIKTFNPSAQETFGYSAKEIIGRNVSLLMPQEDRKKHDGYLRTYCETGKKKFIGQGPRQQVGRHKDGHEFPMELAIAQVSQNNENKVFVGIARNISDQIEAETSLRQQNERFDAALSNMSQGLCMFDSEKRIIVSNDRYALMYGLTLEQVKPGTSLNTILKYRADIGIYPEFNSEAYISQIQQGVTSDTSETVIQQLSDGRSIAIVRKPMSGGGWLATHEDVTEIRQADEKLRQQNERFDAALSNMSQGLCMFDKDQRVVVSNERYASMYGLSLDQITPGTSFRQILDGRIANDIYAGDDPKEYIKEATQAVRAPEAAKKTLELTNGRFVEISYQPMADGGWVDTHEDVTEYRRIEKRIAYLAYNDALTELPNRVQLIEKMQEELKRTHRGETFALLCLDLDGFKGVNDTLGHVAGDKLLKIVSKRLRNCVRETDLVARLGGDEFAIIQISRQPRKEAAVLAERICSAIRAPVKLGQNEVVLEMSIGIAVAPDDGDDYEELLKNADMALYQTKQDGRGIYCFFKPEMEQSVKDRHALALDLRKALAGDQFELLYQPLINLPDNKVCGFEALLRWHHPERGTVSPLDFIPIAEDTGLINQIGEWVLNQACAMAVNWPDDIKVAINVSPVQIRRGNLLEVVKNALATSKLPASRLEIEITESVLIADSDATIEVLQQLHRLGVQISMDDFGTGYSSLSYLQSFPFDKIKIDSSFVNSLETGNDGIGIIQAVVGFASRLGVITTAEGVETQEQLNIVRKEGCTQAQGYFFSRPMPASEISLMFLRQISKKIKNVA